MLVLTIRDGDYFYIGDQPVRVLIEEYYVAGELERVVEFEIAGQPPVAE